MNVGVMTWAPRCPHFEHLNRVLNASLETPGAHFGHVRRDGDGAGVMVNSGVIGAVEADPMDENLTEQQIYSLIENIP